MIEFATLQFSRSDCVNWRAHCRKTHLSRMISVLLSCWSWNYISREFINQPYQVCLLESGGLDFDEVSQSLYTGENTLAMFVKWGTRRYLGGSTNLWEDGVGHLTTLIWRPPWKPYRLPFTKELVPYYERAKKPVISDLLSTILRTGKMPRTPATSGITVPWRRNHHISVADHPADTLAWVRLTEQKLSRRETSRLIWMPT